MNVGEIQCLRCNSHGSHDSYKGDSTITCKACERILYRQV